MYLTSLIGADVKRDSIELHDHSEMAYAKQHAMSKRGMCIFGPYFTGNSRHASSVTSLRSKVARFSKREQHITVYLSSKLSDCFREIIKDLQNEDVLWPQLYGVTHVRSNHAGQIRDSISTPVDEPGSIQRMVPWKHSLEQ